MNKETHYGDEIGVGIASDAYATAFTERIIAYRDEVLLPALRKSGRERLASILQ